MGIIAEIKQAGRVIGIARVSSFAEAFNEMNEYIQQQTKTSPNLTAPIEMRFFDEDLSQPLYSPNAIDPGVKDILKRISL